MGICRFFFGWVIRTFWVSRLVYICRCRTAILIPWDFKTSKVICPNCGTTYRYPQDSEAEKFKPEEVCRLEVSKERESLGDKVLRLEKELDNLKSGSCKDVG